jgi:transcriptional regulator with XRE-family HTH domain
MYRLAKESGLSTEGVSKLETAGSDPKLSTLYKLAEALGVGARELVPEVAAGGRAKKGGRRG